MSLVGYDISCSSDEEEATPSQTETDEIMDLENETFQSNFETVVQESAEEIHPSTCLLIQGEKPIEILPTNIEDHSIKETTLEQNFIINGGKGCPGQIQPTCNKTITDSEQILPNNNNTENENTQQLILPITGHSIKETLEQPLSTNNEDSNNGNLIPPCDNDNLLEEELIVLKEYRHQKSVIISSDSEEDSSSEVSSSDSEDDFGPKSSIKKKAVSSSSSSDESENNDKPKPVAVEPKKQFVKKKMSLLDCEIELPPIEDLNINVEESEAKPIGSITQIIKELVIVQAYPGKPAIDLDSILFLDCGKRALGEVFDVFGPVNEPLYVVRFNSAEHVKAKGIEKGTEVYYAPQTEHTSFIIISDLMSSKGSDASWKDNREPPESCLDYSDDEQENLAKKARKMKKNANGVALKPASPNKKQKKNPFSSNFNDVEIVHQRSATPRYGSGPYHTTCNSNMREDSKFKREFGGRPILRANSPLPYQSRPPTFFQSFNRPPPSQSFIVSASEPMECGSGFNHRPPKPTFTPPPRVISFPPPLVTSLPPPCITSLPPPPRTSLPPPLMTSLPPPHMTSLPPPRMTSLPPPPMTSGPPSPALLRSYTTSSPQPPLSFMASTPPPSSFVATSQPPSFVSCTPPPLFVASTHPPSFVSQPRIASTPPPFQSNAFSNPATPVMLSPLNATPPSAHHQNNPLTYIQHGPPPSPSYAFPARAPNETHYYNRPPAAEENANERVLFPPTTMPGGVAHHSPSPTLQTPLLSMDEANHPRLPNMSMPPPPILPFNPTIQQHPHTSDFRDRL